VFSRR